MSDEEYIERFDQQALANNIVLTQNFVGQLRTSGIEIAAAIYEGYRYACELLRIQGTRNTASRMALAATIIGTATYNAGLQPHQQAEERARLQEQIREAYRCSPAALRPLPFHPEPPTGEDTP